MSNYEPMWERSPIEARWPAEGPHTLNHVMDAVHAFSTSVRYLNNAVSRDHADESLPTVSDLGRLLGQTWTGVEELRLVIDQLRVVLMERTQDDPTLNDKHHPGDPDAVTQTAREATAHLQRAGEALNETDKQLVQATAATNRLVRQDAAE